MQFHLSGIAIVNAEGQIVQATTSSDVKLAMKFQEALDQPVLDYLAKIRQAQYSRNDGKAAVRSFFFPFLFSTTSLNQRR